MQPKDKAYQLVTRFYLALPNNGSETGVCNVHQRWQEGKLCAAMAVAEIINSVEEEHVSDLFTEYWQQVKQEIENTDY